MLCNTLALLAFFSASAVSAAFRGRTLGPASYKSSLSTRSHPYELSDEAELVYAEHSNAIGTTTYGAKVKVISDKPILVLEHMEHQLSTVKCSSGSIYLSKCDALGSEGFDDLHELVGGHVITSHPGYNAEHERLPYGVLAVEGTSTGGVVLSVLPATWEGSFKKMKVQLGYTTDGRELRSHSEIRRRLQRRQSNSTNIINTVPTLPAPDPNNLPNTDDTAGSVNLTAALINKPIPLPDDIPINLTCIDCRTFGSIDYSFGDFDIDLDDGFSVTGAATITAQGFGALVNVSASIEKSFTFLTPLLSAIAMDSSIHIPGLGKAGLTIGPFIAGGYDLNGSLAISSYGFEMRVPDDSQITLNITSLSSSSITGFSNTTVTPLPLAAQVEISSLNAWAALRSTIAFNAADIVAGQGDAGVYVDTPIIIVNATRKSGVGADCQPTDQGKGLESAMRVDYHAGWNFGAYINDSISLLDDTWSWSPDPFYSNGVPKGLPSQCRGFVDNGYVNASVALQRSAGAMMTPQSGRVVVLGALGVVAVTMPWH